MTDKYSYVSLGEEILCREDSIPLLSRISNLIFDCDGVIVSDRDSYRQAIARSVDYYFLTLVGLNGEKGRLVTQADIQKIKDTGAFNNDWNLTYLIITYYLGLLIRKLYQASSEDILRDLEDVSIPDPERILERLKRLGAISAQFGLDVECLGKLKSDPQFGLWKLLEKPVGNEQNLILRDVEKALGLVKHISRLVERLCPYDIEEDDLLRRLFDEIYLGQSLYTRFSNRKPFFDFTDGLIEEEDAIPNSETLDKLKSRFGLFGIFSERPRQEGLYVLEKHNLLQYFDREAIFFGEDIARISGDSMGSLNWGKPDARAFVTVLRRLSRSSVTAYVGDTVSDALMIRNARDLVDREVLFIGTLYSSPTKERLRGKFLELGSEIIVKDVNALPLVFDRSGM
ncbi:hypothetical protein MUP59_03145 [Candidatus Bathyarchaeota archaeon]|nr:hypothetical protein [Candidatus Bathyarchaeota archaeon]